ncbi:MAG: glycosyltransferase family 4 protein [Chloroflexota bacterium]
MSRATLGDARHGLAAEPQTTLQPEAPLRDSRAAALRLLLVTPRYFPFMGGVETHVDQVARRLAGAGVDVTVLTTDPTGQLPGEEKTEGVTIRRVRAWPSQRDYYFAPGIYPAITRGGWDLVHIQSYHTLVAPLAMLAAWRAGIPYVLTFHSGGHSSRLRNAIRNAQRAALRPLLRHARRLVAVAQFERALVARQLGIPQERIALIPNGSDLPAVHAIAPAQAAADGTVVVSVGRLERYKGHQHVIAALPRVLQQRPDVRLRVLGAGPYREQLQQLAERLGVAERVEIRAVPTDDRRAMATALAQAALVVSLSEYETHPVAMMEALALRRPVLVADNSGLHELAERGWAASVALEGGEERVAAAIVEQLRAPHLPGDIAFPTWDDCAHELLALYEETVAGRAPCAS